MRITISNQALGTEARINVPADGILSYWQVRDAQRRLGTPPGFTGAGPLGEVGEQAPPETPGWVYSFEALGDGRVRCTPAAAGPEREAIAAV